MISIERDENVISFVYFQGNKLLDKKVKHKGGVNLAKSGFFGSGIERKTRTKVRSLFH